MNPPDPTQVFNSIVSNGVWALAVFLVMVQVAGQYIITKIFKGMVDEKEETIRKFSEVIEKITEAFNRRTRSENARNEIEALQLSTRPDIHADLKRAAAEAVNRIRDDMKDPGPTGNG